MPTISIDPQDFRELLGFDLADDSLARQLDLVKGEFKGTDEDGQWRVELNDTNRPDLWSAEGIARQMRSARGRLRDYPFFTGESTGELRVDGSVREIRPFVAAFIARGVNVSERSLAQLIQTQEKLAENFGAKRRDVAIGVYSAEKISMPVTYTAVDRNKGKFVPLGFEEAMSPAEILEQHPKGIEYRGILAGFDRVPMLVDAEGLTLSMPPVINSRDLGEVQAGDADLFVEATGTDLNKVILAMNIMACDLADRGGRIERVRTLYPYTTSLGEAVDVPHRLDCGMRIPRSEFGRLLGVDVTAVELERMLESYGCEVRIEEDVIHVQPAPTRFDYLHPVDVVEDFAITRGYETFEPRMPQSFTTGRADRLSQLEDKARDVMVGLGYEEIISNMLLAREQLRGRMNQPDDLSLVEVSNVMNENYSALRDSLLPCLLRVESRSATAAYPHRLFEAGEVALFDREAAHGSHTRLFLASLLAHREANLSEAHADLEYLLHLLDVDWHLKEAENPSFLPGRVARICVGERDVGWLGELHPEVLTSWEIGVPTAGFELDLGAAGL